MKAPTSKVMLAGIAGLSLAAIGVALVSQHVFDMRPCPWCVLQRLIFLTVALVALIGVAWQSPIGSRAVPLALLALGAAGMATALWQHFVAAASNSCNLTLADRIMTGSGLPALLPEVFEARATCADAAVDMLGVPYALWGFALFVLIDAASSWLLVRTLRRA